MGFQGQEEPDTVLEGYRFLHIGDFLIYLQLFSEAAALDDPEESRSVGYGVVLDECRLETIFPFIEPLILFEIFLSLFLEEFVLCEVFRPMIPVLVSVRGGF